MIANDLASPHSTVVVTGAAGFIGSHLAEALVRHGYTVIGIDRRALHDDASAASNLSALVGHPHFSYCQTDLNLMTSGDVLAGVSAVFHLSAATGVRRSWGEDFDDHVHSNVLATQRLLEKCVRAGVRRLVIASSSSVYGEWAGSPAHEDDMTAPLSPYGVTKLAAEQLALAYAHRPGCRISVVALRYFTVYGPRQREDMVISRMLGAALTGKPVMIFGDGQQRRDFTYVGDVVEATIRAAEIPAQAEVVNVAGGGCTPLNELRDLIGKITGRAVPTVAMDHHPGDVMATDADLTRAQQLLGYHPKVSMADGIDRQWQWLLDQSAAFTPGSTR